METKNVILLGIMMAVLIIVFLALILPAIRDYLNNENGEIKEVRENTTPFSPDSI